MRFLDLFRWRAAPSRNQPTRIARGAPFVLTLEGNLYVDTSGRATDVALAGGAKEVAGAGRIIVTKGRVLEITNESPTYHPSLAQMRTLVARLAGMGVDLKGNGGGAVVIVYKEIDECGVGKDGSRYRVVNSTAGVELIPEKS